MPTVIRRALPAEHRQIGEIERSAARLFATVGMTDIAEGEPTSIEFIEAVARAGAVYVATVGAMDWQELAGFALVGFLDQAAHIHELSVAEEHGRKGIGRQLIETACNFAADNGRQAVTLSTFRDIPWNGPFYQRLGFRFLQRIEWTPAMFLLHDREVQNGLPVEQRGFMRKDLT
jgi:ribosomal protein S18 acetylase RimI-like enzyme